MADVQQPKPGPTLEDLAAVVDEQGKAQQQFALAIQGLQASLDSMRREMTEAPKAVPAAPGAPQPGISYVETKSLVDDILGRINRNTIVGGVLVYEVLTGHLNKLLKLVQMFLAANPGP